MTSQEALDTIEVACNHGRGCRCYGRPSGQSSGVARPVTRARRHHGDGHVRSGGRVCWHPPSGCLAAAYACAGRSAEPSPHPEVALARSADEQSRSNTWSVIMCAALLHHCGTTSSQPLYRGTAAYRHPFPGDACLFIRGSHHCRKRDHACGPGMRIDAALHQRSRRIASVSRCMNQLGMKLPQHVPACEGQPGVERAKRCCTQQFHVSTLGSTTPQHTAIVQLAYAKQLVCLCVGYRLQQPECHAQPATGRMSAAGTGRPLTSAL